MESIMPDNIKNLRYRTGGTFGDFILAIEAQIKEECRPNKNDAFVYWLTLESSQYEKNSTKTS